MNDTFNRLGKLRHGQFRTGSIPGGGMQTKMNATASSDRSDIADQSDKNEISGATADLALVIAILGSFPGEFRL